MQIKNCDRDKAFSNTMKSGPSEFTIRLKQIIKSCNDKSFKSNHVVFLDKNYPKD